VVLHAGLVLPLRILHVGAQDVLRHLVQRHWIARELISGLLIYTSVDPESAKSTPSTPRWWRTAAESGAKPIPIIRRTTGKTILRPLLVTASSRVNAIRSGVLPFL
jgi:hypothetical protein